MPFIIDSTSQLPGTSAKSFFEFLKKQCEQQKAYFREGINCCGYTFESPMIFYPQKRSDSFVGEYICHVLSKDPMGNGGFAQVYGVEQSFRVTSDSIVYSDKKDPIVVKCQQHSSHPPSGAGGGKSLSDEPISLARVRDEHEMSLKMALGKVPLVIDRHDQFSYNSLLIMERAPGCELHTIIADDQDAQIECAQGIPSTKRILSLLERLELIVALLNELAKQIKAGVIHADLKPANIIVNLPPFGVHQALQVRFVDYGSAALPGTKVYRQTGTLGYASREQLSGRFIYENSLDIFTMARICTLIWGGDDRSFNGYNNSAEEYEQYTTYLNLERHLENLNLFQGLPKQQREELRTLGVMDHIRTALNFMLDNDPKERPPIQDACEIFTDILQAYKFNKPNKMAPNEAVNEAIDKAVFPVPSVAHQKKQQRIAVNKLSQHAEALRVLGAFRRIIPVLDVDSPPRSRQALSARAALQRDVASGDDKEKQVNLDGVSFV